MRAALKRYGAVSLLALASVTSVAAQFERLDGQDDFSEEAVSLWFSHVPLGVDVRQALAKWGVHFSGTGGARPTSEGYVPPLNILPPVLTALVNRPPGESSAGQSLVIDFDRPARRVALFLGVPLPPLVVRAYAPDGSFLGEVGIQDLDLINSAILPLGTSHPEGFTKLVLDHGDAAQPERLEGLTIDPVAARRYETAIAQVAEVASPAANIRTTLALVNFSTTTARAEIQLVSSDGSSAGAPAVFLVERGEAHFVETSDLVSGPFVGYATISSTTPLAANAVYQTSRGPGESFIRAGIAAAPGRISQYGAVEFRSLQGTVQPTPRERTDTGVALANLSDMPAEVFLVVRYRDLDGIPQGLSTTLRLQPREHRAAFLSQLFTLESPVIVGSLSILSEQLIAATLLNTVDGLAVASLPLDSLEP